MNLSLSPLSYNGVGQVPGFITDFLQPYIGTVLLMHLSYHHPKISSPSGFETLQKVFLERKTGFEPATLSLEG